MARDVGPGSPTERLRALATQLREAAAQAGRVDVAAKADEAIALLAAGDGDPERKRGDAGNAILRTLDGLGF
jgi:hypothetical protein